MSLTSSAANPDHVHITFANIDKRSASWGSLCFSSGLTLIWGMMNVVNFAHGDFVMIAMYTAFIIWKLLGGGPLLAMPAAAVLLATIGIIAYLGLVRHIMRGPMLAQILGTFGLALLLRYGMFWGFGANFLSLPENLVGGTYEWFGVRLQASRLMGGGVAVMLTPNHS